MPREVTVGWKNGSPIRVRVEHPTEVSPERAQAILDLEQAREFPWQTSTLAGDMTPEEYAWFLDYWKTLPGTYTFFDAVTHRAGHLR